MVPFRIPVFFNEIQLQFKPMYEWAFGERINHPETTKRAENILAALQGSPADFDVREPLELALGAIRGVHDERLIALYTSARNLENGTTFYPSVFPKASQGLGDPTNLKHAGAFCFDSGTPLSADTWFAALWSASSARAAARELKKGAEMSYALSRPPGHHATRDLFGGYCYFNNAAIAAKALRPSGRVAIVDIDYHHGNGTQSIFYRDPRVLMISAHADPTDVFPLFSGFAGETGAGPGAGFNANIPLLRGCDGQGYLEALDRHVVPRLIAYEPKYLILSAGLDTYEKDPVGDFKLTTNDLFHVGVRFGRLGIPIAIVQEGGYYTRHLGRNAQSLLYGIRDGLRLHRTSLPGAEPTLPEPQRLIRERDIAREKVSASRARSPWHRTQNIAPAAPSAETPTPATPSTATPSPAASQAATPESEQKATGPKKPMSER